MLIFSTSNEGVKINMENHGMQARIHTVASSIDLRLSELGLSRDELIEVVMAAVTARKSCTGNDPLSAPGWMSWKEGSRRLREMLLPKGFLRSNDDGVPWVIDPKSGARFCVVNTNDGTGLLEREPQQSSKKGPATNRAVSRNSAPLFEAMGLKEPAVEASTVRQPFTQQAWYLCVYCEGDVIRAELSLPVSMSDGYFERFQERIFILGPNDGQLVVRREERPSPDGGEFDIPVSRK